MSTRETYAALNQPARSNITRGMDRILSMPLCYVAQPGAQSIANGADVISFTTAARDTDGMFNIATPTRVTCRTQGIYDVKWNIVFAISAAGTHRQGWVSVNGGSSRFGNDIRPSVPVNGYGRVAGSDSITLNAGDYMELVTEQDGGATTLGPAVGYNGAELNVCLISL